MISRSQLNQLIEHEGYPCVSIYIPTFRVGQEQEDQIRFKNGVQKAQNELEDSGMERADALAFLAKGHQLIDNDDFWRHQQEGLAVFIGKDFFAQYTLPVHFKQHTSVDQHFHIRPLMPLFTEQTDFYLLALSQNEVRFFKGDRHSIHAVDVSEHVPPNMDKALMLDPDASLQMHGSDSPGAGIYHGHGGGKDKMNGYLKEYFAIVDRGLREFLDDETIPMILATVDVNASIYQDTAKYTHLKEKFVSGSPEDLSGQQLHEQAWEIMEGYANTNKNNFRDEFGDYLAQNRASTSATDIIASAIEGKVQSVFINKDAELYGTYDPELHKVSVHQEKQADSQDLMELLARRVFTQDGQVFNLAQEDFPHQDADVNAIYRF
jgi:hypothetical protein